VTVWLRHCLIQCSGQGKCSYAGLIDWGSRCDPQNSRRCRGCLATDTFQDELGRSRLSSCALRNKHAPLSEDDVWLLIEPDSNCLRYSASRITDDLKSRSMTVLADNVVAESREHLNVPR
jgi:hypothetical protein